MQEYNIPRSAAPWDRPANCLRPRFRVARQWSLPEWPSSGITLFTSIWKVPYFGPVSEHPSWLSAIPWTSWYWYLLEISKSTHPSPNPDHLPPNQLLHLPLCLHWGHSHSSSPCPTACSPAFPSQHLSCYYCALLSFCPDHHSTSSHVFLQ